MTPEEYSALPGLNWSTLKFLATSPRLLRWRVDTPEEDKDAYRLGRAMHCAILEPERFAREYFAWPDFGDMRYKENKDRRSRWLDGLPVVREVLRREEFAICIRTAESLRAHPKASEIFTGGRAEEAITWTDPDTGIVCKGRLDWVTLRYIADLKSTRRETLRSIVRDFESLLYYGQLAYYWRGAIAAGMLPSDAERPCGAFVQTVEPYDVVAFRMTERTLQVGNTLVDNLLRKYKECQAAKWWPGLASDVIEIELSQYANAGEPVDQEW